MANLSKERRDRMIAKLEELKLAHNDDASIAALNEIENALREKKYGLVWEEHSEAVDDMLRENIPVLVEEPDMRLCRDPELPWNFIIEGDNLQALYLLEKTHRGKVDCIYIDPPYNTGARDWKYNNDYVDGNDQYRHSKWLSMMKSRLLVAKRLLNPRDSVLIVTIDEKEYLRLGCLLEEIFPDGNMQMISVMTNKKGSTRPGQFSRAGEYIYLVYIGCCSITPTNDNMLLPQIDGVDNAEGKSITIWNSLLRRGTAALRQDRPNLFYPIYVDKSTQKIVCVGDPIPLFAKRENTIVPNDLPESVVACWPMRKDGIEGRWQMSHTTLQKRINEHRVKAGQFNNSTQQFSIVMLKDKQMKQIDDGVLKIVGIDDTGAYTIENSDEETKMSQSPRTMWARDSHDASVYGSTFIKGIIKDHAFAFPKSLYAVQDTLRFFTAKKTDALIVDFFAGSGTTMHAVNLLNAEDGGHRRCIMVTNNEVSEAEAKSMKEKRLKPGDPEWEALGIARYVTWPRTVCSIEGHDINGNPLKGNYLGSDIPMADGFNANVKYFKCDWTPRKPEEYLLSNALCLHIKEMIELQTAREVDGEKVVLILSKEDYHRVFDDPAAAEKAQDVWVNENLFFNNAEMRVLMDKHFKYIPREFFSQELKEAGEYV